MSDIDMTIITRGSKAKRHVQKELMKLHKVFPILEPESQVLSVQDFLSLFDEKQFSTNRSILYRIFEAKFTWKLIHATQPFDLLDKIDFPTQRGLDILLLSELLYWHGIVISEYTSFQLGHTHKTNAFQDKRRCWMFMKATTEFTNFFNALSNRGNLVFSRKRIIQEAIHESPDPTWIDLFRKNELILDNRFNWEESEAYLAETFAYLSYLYQRFFQLLSAKFKNDFEFIQWIRNTCPVDPMESPLECHSIDLKGWEGGLFFKKDDLQALFITPQPTHSVKTKVLVSFILNTLDSVPKTQIHAFLEALRNHLQSQHIIPSEIEPNIIAHIGFLCFSAPLQFSLPTHCVLKNNAIYFPSLYELIYDHTIDHHQGMKVIDSYFKRPDRG